VEVALGWLGDIFRMILSFIPRIILVRTTHQGVKWKWGYNVCELNHDNGVRILKLRKHRIPIHFPRTGIHIYWPLVSEYEVVPIKRQTVNMVPQYLMTEDGQTVGVSGILVYEIGDVEKLLTECYDYDETIRDLSLATVKDIITANQLRYIQTHGKEIDKQLTLTLREQLRRFGVRTIRVTLSDFTKSRTIALWGSSQHSHQPAQ
jgi:regulator of protease activity HflC (stomatin/prohibitin superfamily)